MKVPRETLKYILWSITIYLILIIAYGYDLGGENGGMLSLALKKLNPQLYPKDLYIQALSKNAFNERTFYLYLILPVAKFPSVGIIYHAIVSVFLILGLLKIARTILKNSLLIWSYPLISVFLLYYINWGANEFYYNNIQPATIAKTLLIWAWFFLLQKKSKKLPLITALIITATLLQPMIGLQTFIILTPYWIFFLRKNVKNIIYFLLWLLTAGTYIGILFLTHEQGENIPFYNKIMFHFRHALHFIPHCFSKKGTLLFPTLLAIILYFTRKEYKLIFFSFVILALALIMYSAVFYLLNSEVLLVSQWFRATIWIKIWGIIFLLKMIEKYVEKISSGFNVKQLLLMTMILLAIIYNSAFYGKHTGLYEIFPNLRKKNPQIDLALKIKEITPVDAVILHPPMKINKLKFWSQRSCYIDWRHVMHSKSPEVLEWAKRIKLTTGLDYKNTICRWDFINIKQVDENYINLCKNTEKLSELGINYFVLPANVCIDKKPIYKNYKWSLYKVY